MPNTPKRTYIFRVESTLDPTETMVQMVLIDGVKNVTNVTGEITLKAQVRKEIDGLKKQRLDSLRSFGDGDIVNVASGYNQDLLDRKAEEIRKLKEPMEDDEETCLYRHCSEGDHWKCGGDGEGGRCVCRCHALDQAISILKERV